MKPYLRLRQICLVAPELEAAVDTVRDLFGLEVCFRDENVAQYGLVNALFVFGHAFLEIVAPTREGTAAGRFLEKAGGGGYMAIFDCDDPLVRRQRAVDMGVRIAHELTYPTFWGSQFHPRDCRATMLEFDHTVGGESVDGAYHPAGAHWKQFQRLDKVGGIPGIEVSSGQAAELARFWSALLDRPLIEDSSATIDMRLDLGTVRFVSNAPGETSEMLRTLCVSVGDVDAVRRAAERRGCLLPEGELSLYGVKIRLIGH